MKNLAKIGSFFFKIIGLMTLICSPLMAEEIGSIDNPLRVMLVPTDGAVEEVKGSAPILSFSERLELAQSIRYVDLVVRQDEYSPLKNVKNIKPTILMESESHSKVQLEASRKCMEEIGGKMIIMPYFKGQSSTRIKNLAANASKPR